MPPKILIVDRNQAFATMLEEMLESDSSYSVEVASSGSDALALLHQEDFALVIIDTDLDPEDMGYRDLILGARKLRPTMRIMVIPLTGQTLPQQVERLDIQGTLSKPFFADDLLPSIQEALSKEVKASPPRPTALPEMPQPADEARPQIQPTLAQLAHEVNADTVLLLSAGDGGVQIITQVSTLDATQLGTLSDLIASTVRSAQEVAQFLGQSHKPFEHHMFEGAASRLYIMAIEENVLLAVTTPVSIPLGTVRHNLRRTIRTLKPSIRA